MLYDSTWPLHAVARARGRDLPRRAATRRCATTRFTRVARAHADEEHRYVGTLAALLDIDMDVVAGMLDGEVREEAGADGVEPEGHPARLRLREEALRLPAPHPPREDGRDERRRSSSTATPRPRSAASTRAPRSPRGTPSRRRRACSTPSRRFCDEVPHRQGDRREALLHPAGRGRARGRSAWSSARRGTGARSFTSTAGPGISLMNELIGLAYYAEIPAVIVDVQRVGPVDRHAHAHAAGRHPALRVRLARRHEAHPALPGEPGASASSSR